MFQKWKISFFLLFSKALSFLKTEEGISPMWTMYNANPIFKYLQFTLLLQRFGPIKIMVLSSVQVSSVTQSCLTLCNPMDCSMPGLPVHHQLPEFTQAHVHWVGDAIQPSPVQFFATPQPVSMSPGSSVHGILQAWIREWVAMPFSRGILPTQGLNLHLLCSYLHRRVGSLPLVPPGKLKHNGQLSLFISYPLNPCISNTSEVKETLEIVAYLIDTLIAF